MANKQYYVSETRYQLLQDHFFQYSFDGRKPDRVFFDSITNPIDYYLIADFYNWDDGTEVLDWIVSSPICDKGTVLLIFWRAQPEDYTTLLSAEEADWDADIYNLLQKIITNWANGYYKTTVVSYDPRIDNDMNYRDPEAKWSIPDDLRLPTENGLEINFDHLE